MYLTTNTQTYIVTEREDGTLAITDLCGKSIKNAGLLIASIGGIEAVKVRLTAELPQADKAAREAREAAKAEAIAEARQIIKNPHASAAELLRAAKVLSKAYGMSPELDKIFGSANELSAKLLAYGGGYNFNTYDNGETLVKFANGKRFSTVDRNSRFADTRSLREIVEA